MLGFAVEPQAETREFDEIVAPLPEASRARIRAQLPVLRAAILKEVGACESSENLSDAAAAVLQNPPDGDASELVTPGIAAVTAPRSPARANGWTLAGMAAAAAVLLAGIVFFLR
jgi:hypothetical protein